MIYSEFDNKNRDRGMSTECMKTYVCLEILTRGVPILTKSCSDVDSKTFSEECPPNV